MDSAEDMIKFASHLIMITILPSWLSNANRASKLPFHCDKRPVEATIAKQPPRKSPRSKSDSSQLSKNNKTPSQKVTVLDQNPTATPESVQFTPPPATPKE